MLKPEEEKYQNLVNTLQMIIDHSPAAIAMFDREMRYIWASNRWITDFKLKQPITGLSHYVVFPEITEEWRQVHKRCLAGAIEKKDEEAFVRANGSIDWIRWEVRPWYDAHGQIGGIVIFSEDISGIKNAFLEIEKARNEAMAANQAKSLFLANMSHEIRTPLGVILGFSELLNTQNLSSTERKEFVDVIIRNGNLLLSIINDILDISKIEAGKIKIEITEVSFAELIDNIKHFFESRHGREKLTLNIQIDKNVPKTICTDQTRVNQIINNIVGNAIKFTPSGRIDIAVHYRKGNLGALSVDVTDTGIGIEESKIGKLFATFSQADETYTRRHGGSGLGLALSRQLALMLGGDIKLTKTEFGKGSSFNITIADFANPNLSRESEFHRAEQLKAIDPIKGLDLLNVSVLYTDDSFDNQKLFAGFLESAGAKVELASSGNEAVEQIKSGRTFDLILLDLQMPNMDGYQAVKAIRSLGYEKPIVALTAHFMSGEKKKCLESGFDDHISKPIERAMLIKKVLESLNSKQPYLWGPAHR